MLLGNVGEQLFIARDQGHFRPGLRPDAMAIAFPNPLLAPVTSATFPDNPEMFMRGALPPCGFITTQFIVLGIGGH